MAMVAALSGIEYNLQCTNYQTDLVRKLHRGLVSFFFDIFVFKHKSYTVLYDALDFQPSICGHCVFFRELIFRFDAVFV